MSSILEPLTVASFTILELTGTTRQLSFQYVLSNMLETSQTKFFAVQEPHECSALTWITHLRVLSTSSLDPGSAGLCTPTDAIKCTPTIPFNRPVRHTSWLILASSSIWWLRREKLKLVGGFWIILSLLNQWDDLHWTLIAMNGKRRPFVTLFGQNMGMKGDYI